ncbi:DUF6615 family protein [Burkholderia sp. Bp9142]|uniref:DUF6615 family protein n=1 Tax=Burkholderia sp. Bp9142 TaxID=2184573 RepID=UPI000F5B5097|nr:DUF6615 family protein [Burkholderia sp. Bp9142]
MNICDASLALDREVRLFMENVADVKEESITDFLVWKWRELDKRFNFIRVYPFNHEEESSRTGADFDIELWLVGRERHIALAVQAKKFVKRADSYVAKLRYPRSTKNQLNTLLSYAASNNRQPFYFIYSLPDSPPHIRCKGGHKGLGAIFTADAREINEYADGKHGNRITRDKLLEITNPFHCIFCCPFAHEYHYFDHYFSNSRDSQINEYKDNESLPIYVRQIMQEGDTPVDIDEYESLRQFRLVGVYDMRNGR